MKTLIIALCLTSAIVFAQTPTRPTRALPQAASETGDVLPENYLLKLTVNDKDQQITELSVVIATTQFKADTFDPTMTITGALTPEEDGSILVRYALGTEIAVPSQTATMPSPSGQPVTTVSSIQYKTGSVQASVRLRLGEPVQILKSGTRSYQLTVSHLTEGTKKDK
jgi:hypothetical protein